MYPFPRPYIDEYIADADTGFSRYYQTNTVGASLRLVTMNAQFYQGNYDIDYTKAVKVQSHDPNVYAAHQVFEIRNKRYVCKEMEFTLDAFGRKGAWTGTFYPIRVRDTRDLNTPAGQHAAVTAARRLREEGAAVIALACTGFSTIGLAPQLERAVGIPVLDPVTCEAQALLALLA